MPLAQGLIITESSLSAFIGPITLAQLSSQNNASTTNNSAAIQIAINASEARIAQKLLIPQCKSGSFLKFPFTCGGIALLGSGSVIALPALQMIAHEYACFILNRWRSALSIPEDTSAAGIARMCAGYDTDGDKRIAEIINWIWGYSKGAGLPDLDLNAGAVVGAPTRNAPAPVYGVQTIGPDGRPYRPIVSSADLWFPAYPIAE